MRLEKNEKGFYFFDLHSGNHGHMKTRVWVNQNLVTQKPEGAPEVFFPCHGLIVKTDKGSLVLRLADKELCYYTEIPSGYRGSASIDKVDGGEIVVNGQAYHSGTGSLGETAWALINAPDGEAITVHGRRSGRRVADGVAFRLTPDGKQEDLVEDGLEAELL